MNIAVVGTSWGGLAALSELIRDLPHDFPVPVCIVQHRSKDSDTFLVEILQDLTSLKIFEAEDKQSLCAGSIYIAPPDYHMLLDKNYISLTVDSPVRFSRPSIDVLFNSAADAFGAGVVGVILTGANEDGSKGLARIVSRGGKAIVQDPATSESPVMPAAARHEVPSAKILPLGRIAMEIESIVRAQQPRVRRAS